MIVFGMGGHADEIVEAMRTASWQPSAFMVDRAFLPRDGTLTHRGKPILQTENFDGPGFIAIGDPLVRADVATRLTKPKWQDIVHASAAWEGRRAPWGPRGLYLGFGAYVGPNAHLGDHVHVNRGAMVSHDCGVGDFVHVAPGAQLLGACQVGRLTEIGGGAIVLPKVRIGARCRIGAGSVVTRDVPDGWTVRGNPARMIAERKEAP